MASPTQWTWVWVNSGSWWWTGRPGVLQFMGSQRVRHVWATKLNWKGIWVTEFLLLSKLTWLLLLIALCTCHRSGISTDWNWDVAHTYKVLPNYLHSLPWWLSGKEPTCQCRRHGFHPWIGLGISPGEGNDNPPQYSCWENSMDRGTWQATVHVAAGSWMWFNWAHIQNSLQSSSRWATLTSLQRISNAL